VLAPNHQKRAQKVSELIMEESQISGSDKEVASKPEAQPERQKVLHDLRPAPFQHSWFVCYFLILFPFFFIRHS
jgi:hypothetical protein